MYRVFLKDVGKVHLKTDNLQLYMDTMELIRSNDLPLERYSTDVYNEDWSDEVVSIQTYYEQSFLAQGTKINYLCFKLPTGKEIKELPDD